jgi:hypothetical protein
MKHACAPSWPRSLPVARPVDDPSGLAKMGRGTFWAALRPGLRPYSFVFVPLLCAVILAGCKSGTAGVVITVSISPTGINVPVGTTQQFTATVANTSNQNVTWSVVGGSTNGTISTTGLYTAPATVPTPATVMIMAVSQRQSTATATATLTVTSTSTPSSITVVVTPSAPSVSSFGTQQFTATVSGTTNTTVTWQVNGTTGGSQTLGYISTSGLYYAPGGPPTAPSGKVGTVATTLTVTAVSQADSSATGSATVTVTPANQSAQAIPIDLGSSGGNINDSNTTGNTIECCGGTLGSLVTLGGTQYILSNNHVLARSDAASTGEAIIQPGLIDVNCNKTQATTVANLSQFANLQTESNSASPSNIDAAIAQVVAGEVDPSGNILYLGSSADVNGVPQAGAPNAGSGVTATVNMPVAKSGRTTGLTCSTVMSITTETSVQYTQNCDGSGTSFTVEYEDQVDVAGGDFSGEGDSGSLIVSQNTADPVALLYGGSDTDTVANPVAPVLSFFASGGNSMTFVGGTAHQVIGCSLPTAPSSASKTVPAASVSAEILQTAVTARDAHATELLAHPEVQAVGVGASYDNPAEAAIVFFVSKGQPHTDLPQQVDGIRTRIVEGGLFARKGAISAAESAVNERSVAPPQLTYSISQAEYERAKVVHTAHAKAIMRQPGVQGVGIGSSVDSPGEAALIIFLIRGAAHDPIPPVIDGLRTRVRISSRFTSGARGTSAHPACLVPLASAERKVTAARSQTTE